MSGPLLNTTMLVVLGWIFGNMIYLDNHVNLDKLKFSNVEHTAWMCLHFHVGHRVDCVFLMVLIVWSKENPVIHGDETHHVHICHFTLPRPLLLVRQLWFPVKPVTGGRRETEVVRLKLTFIKSPCLLYCSALDGFEMTVSETFWSILVVTWIHITPWNSNFDEIHL